MTYREIVKLVHPDLNPTIENAHQKMCEVNKNKDNPTMLHNLAIRWGLMEGIESPTQENSYQRSSYDTYSEYRRRYEEQLRKEQEERARKAAGARVGSFVQFKIKKDGEIITVRGCIIKRTKNGEKINVILFTDDRKLLDFSFTKEGFGKINLLEENIPLYNEGWKIWFSNHNKTTTEEPKKNTNTRNTNSSSTKKNATRAEQKAEEEESRNIFYTHGLQDNANYSDLGYKVVINGVVYDLIRTSNHSVYYYDNGKEKRTNIRKVYNTYKD